MKITCFQIFNKIVKTLLAAVISLFMKIYSLLFEKE